ncbi:MAG TPA: twin-arginine translocation signal domain-containing protein, partial [Terracidiphilus sp.]|nr:twin-arginine translocation signal domain-containing protein [Terracidiphilus sp.]
MQLRILSQQQSFCDSFTILALSRDPFRDAPASAANHAPSYTGPLPQSRLVAPIFSACGHSLNGSISMKSTMERRAFLKAAGASALAGAGIFNAQSAAAQSPAANKSPRLLVGCCAYS